MKSENFEFYLFSVKNKELKAKDGKDDKKAEEKKEKKKKNKKYDDVIYVEEMEIDASQLDLETNKPQIIQSQTCLSSKQCRHCAQLLCVW